MGLVAERDQVVEMWEVLPFSTMKVVAPKLEVEALDIWKTVAVLVQYLSCLEASPDVVVAQTVYEQHHRPETVGSSEWGEILKGR